MAETITATFQDGAFVPDQTVHVAAGTRVRLTVEPIHMADESVGNDEQQVSTVDPLAALDELCKRHPIYSGLRLTRDQLHERD